MYIGSENFSVNGHDINISVLNFWQWAYSDLTNNIRRSVLAEYIVATALGVDKIQTEQVRKMWRPYDLLSKEGYRIEVKSAAYVQSWEAKHPDSITYRIAPARLPDETGDYKSNAPVQRNSDLYVFCLFKALTPDESPLNLDLWDFYVLPTRILNDKKPNQKTITFHSLMTLEPLLCDYYGLNNAIELIMNA